MNIVISAFFGGLVGIAGTFLHNSYQPIGLFLSLIAVIWSLILVRQMFNRRSNSIAFSLGWIAVVLRGSMMGNGDELLIQGNAFGNVFVVGGSLAIVVLLIMTRYDR